MIRDRGGFTIVESMIFLTISAVMFVGVYATFQQSQRSTEFSQSVREFESSLNSDLNDTANGVFPDLFDTSCDYGLGTVPVFSADAGARPGDNDKCIFIGKVISFNSDEYTTQTLIGNNRKATGRVTDLASIDVSLLTAGVNSTVTNQLNWRTEVTRVYFTDSVGGVNDIWGVGAVYSQFGSENILDRANFSDGLADISLYAVSGPGALATNLASSGGVASICLRGANDEKAVVDVGRTGSGLNAVAVFEERPECG